MPLSPLHTSSLQACDKMHTNESQQKRMPHRLNLYAELNLRAACIVAGALRSNIFNRVTIKFVHDTRE